MSISPAKIGANPDQTLIQIGSQKYVVRRHSENLQFGEKSAGPGRLTKEEEKVVEELKKRDREVRQHEHKHVAAAGSLVTSGPHYEYQIGPDGKPYAVAGHVRIDTSPVPGDPQATKAKADQIRRAATAPGNPSGPDLAVAADAGKLESEAAKEYKSNQPDSKNDKGQRFYNLNLFA